MARKSDPARSGATSRPRPDKDLRLLINKKNNYGPDDETITLRSKTGSNGSGVFVPEAAPGSLEKMAADSRADELILKLLALFTQQGRNVSHAPTANNYAPSVFAKHPDGKGKKKQLTAAMERLFTASKIRVEEYDRRGSKRIAARSVEAVPAE